MANRYWVGANGASWATASSWSATPGGAGGAGNPTSSDDCYLDSNATGKTISCGTATALSVFVTGTSITLTGISANTGTLSIYGSFDNSNGGISAISTTYLWAINFRSTTSVTIATGGLYIQPLNGISFNGAGGTFTFLDACTFGAPVSISNGTLDLNGKSVGVSGASGYTFTTQGGTKNITFNGGTLFSTGSTAFNNLNPTGFTTTAGTGVGTISCTATTTKTFAGGGSTFNCVLSNGGAGALTVTGTNTFAGLTVSVSSTITLPISVTTNINSTSGITGSSGAVITLTSATSGTTTTVNYSGAGTAVVGDYASFRDITFTPTTPTNGSAPVVWRFGTNTTNTSNNLNFAIVSDTSRLIYLLASGTSWTTPSNFSPTNNEIYLYGGGGGGAGAYSTVTSNQHGGGGGGGGAFTKLVNYPIGAGTSVAYVIGAGGAFVGAGANGNSGKATTWDSGAYSANGGGGGVSLGTGGAGGTVGSIGGAVALAYAGGAGGGGGSTNQTNAGAPGGAGGGAGGPNGTGGGGGTGYRGNAVGTFSGAGAGGGGAGGGSTAATPTATSIATAGGNNYLGAGGGAAGTSGAAAGVGTFGGGGGGRTAGGSGAAGGQSYEVYNVSGGAGGSGSGATSSTITNGTTGASYGAGGSGGSSYTNLSGNGSAGGGGLIIVSYIPGSSGGMFFGF